MAHAEWPFFDLRVRTPQLEMRYIDDALAAALAVLAAKGIHDPSTMPFAFPWSDRPSPELEREIMRYHWRTRAELSADRWQLNFAVLADGVVIGSSGLAAEHFPVLRQFESGSWLGKQYQNQGIGTEMRIATLHVGFAGLGATLARTAAFSDNPRSQAVTRKLGYTEVSPERRLQRDQAGVIRRFEMPVEHWQQGVRRNDIEIVGLDACLPLLGLP